MGQKVHPYGFRLGFNKTWRSRWFADKQYAEAKTVLAHALPLLEKAFGVEHPRVVKTRERLAEAEAALVAQP